MKERAWSPPMIPPVPIISKKDLINKYIKFEPL